ncbi:MAG: hypothetical protein WB998_09155 [Solirubrobacteraceae bacterium]
MAQLSRPYQIALAAVAVLGLVWAVALRAHGPSPSQPAPAKASTAAASPASGGSAASSSASAAAEAKAAAAPTPIYHGAAPGVEGLTRAIAKAHGAVAESQRNVQEQRSKSGEAAEAHAPASASSTNTSPATAQKSLTVAHRTVTHTTAGKTVTKTHVGAVKTSRSPSAAKAHPGRTVQQVAVEAELAHGKTVMLVFWDPRASVDREVLLQVDALAGGSKGTVTVHAALAGQVGMFGKITEVVHVYQTPTILIVNRQGVVSTLSGLTDVFSLRQAVSEAREAKS